MVFTTSLLEGLQRQPDATLADLDRYLCNRLPQLSEYYWRPIQLPILISPLDKSKQAFLPAQPVSRVDQTETTAERVPTTSDKGFLVGAEQSAAHAATLETSTMLAPKPVAPAVRNGHTGKKAAQEALSLQAQRSGHPVETLTDRTLQRSDDLDPSSSPTQIQPDGEAGLSFGRSLWWGRYSRNAAASSRRLLEELGSYNAGVISFCQKVSSKPPSADRIF